MIWIRHNSKHYGSKVSLIEFLQKVVKVEADFLHIAKENNWTARDGDGKHTYKELYFDHVTSHLPSVKSWEFWDNAKSTAHRLKCFGILGRLHLL